MAQWRWGILSTASISEKLVPAIKRCPDSELVAISSRSLEKARAAATMYGIPKVFASYEEMITSGDVNVIYNPLPNSLHLPLTLRCIEAGIPVLCEKPLALSATDAKAIAVASATRRVHVAEAFMYRYHPVFRRLVELVKSGAIGRLHSIHSDFSFFLDEPDGLPAKGTLGGGALLDVGCYCVNFSRLVTDSEPLEVAAMGRFAESGPGSASWEDPEAAPHPDANDKVGSALFDKTLAGMMRFPQGVLATFTTSIGAAEQHRVEVRGDSGILSVEQPWHPRPTEVIRLERHGQPSELIQVQGDNPYYLQVRHFLDVCAHSVPQPLWPIEESVRQAKVMDALARSARSGHFESV